MNELATPVFLARQPIYDRRSRVYAYELLYRGARRDSAGKVGAAESATTLVRAITEIGLDRLVGTKPAFVNIPGPFLTDPSICVLPADRVVLEILEDVYPSTENVDAVAELAAKGYRIVLDDFVLGSPQVEFLPYVKAVKVDVLANRHRMLEQAVALLKKSKVRLLAEKIEDVSMFARCQAMGFHYFQGYLFARPEIVQGRGIPASRTSLLHLLTRLQDENLSMETLERYVCSDVSLTYRLLRLVNSVCVAPDEQVESVRSALMMLGLDRVVALVSLLAMSGIDDKPNELLVTAMVRAKMCESLATSRRLEDSEKHFTVGLLSVLEYLFDVPMNEVVEQIPLSKDVQEALVNPKAKNVLRQSLNVTLAFEEGQWDVLDDIENEVKNASDCYVQSIGWADEVNSMLAA